MPGTPGHRSAATRCWTLGLALVLLLGAMAPLTEARVPPAANQDPVDLVPEDLPASTQRLDAAMVEISQAETVAEMREPVAAMQTIGIDLLGPIQDLSGRHGDLLGTYMDEVEGQVEAGNASDARSIARAAHGLLTDEILPRIEAWAVNQTTVTLAPARHAGDGQVRVPVVIVHPPPGGLGAIDVEASVLTEGAGPVSASLATGQGEARVDEGNASARLASFDASSLAKLSPGNRQVEVLGHLTVQTSQTEQQLSIDVTVHDAADREGRPVAVLGQPAVVEASGSAQLGWRPGTWVALGAVGVMGVAAVVAARRLLEV